VSPIPARKAARRRETEQRRDVRERATAIRQVPVGELPPNAVDDARESQVLSSETTVKRSPVDAHVKRQFTLRNARIDGALLSGTKVFAGGVTKPLEGAFINSTSFDSPTAKGVTTFGLGVIGNTVSNGEFTLLNLYYKKQ